MSQPVAKKVAAGGAATGVSVLALLGILYQRTDVNQEAIHENEVRVAQTEKVDEFQDQRLEKYDRLLEAQQQLNQKQEVQNRILYETYRSRGGAAIQDFEQEELEEEE